MELIRFKTWCCRACSKAVSISDDICDSCGESPNGASSIPELKEMAIKKTGETNWVEGIFIAWAECDGIVFGMTLTAPKFGRFKNMIGMCNHQGIKVDSDHFGAIGLDLFGNGLELVPEGVPNK